MFFPISRKLPQNLFCLIQKIHNHGANVPFLKPPKRSSHRTTNKRSFKCLACTTTTVCNYAVPRSIYDWNGLPNSIVDISDTSLWPHSSITSFLHLVTSTEVSSKLFYFVTYSHFWKKLLAYCTARWNKYFGTVPVSKFGNIRGVLLSSFLFLMLFIHSDLYCVELCSPSYVMPSWCL